MAGDQTTTRTPCAVDVVTEYFTAALDSLASWTDALAGDIESARAAGPVTRARLDAIVEPYALQTLAEPALPVYGAGFIAALDLLADARSHLAWWQGPQRARLTLATQSVNKEHIDYSDLEWYRVPALSGTPHIVGPYVDYLCSDEYTITTAVPVQIGGEFIGVTGLDLLIESVERELTPLLLATGRDVTVVNGVGRVVLSTNPQRATGDSLRGPTLDALERIACDGIPLSVVLD